MDWFEFFTGKWESGNGHSDPVTSYLDDLTSYLTEVPDDEQQFKIQQFLYGADPTGVYRGYLETRDSSNYWNDYFRNTGLTWSDVKYPTRMYGYGSAGSTVRSAFNYVSRNIGRLYR